MGNFGAVAMAFDYPEPGSSDRLRDKWESLPAGGTRRQLLKFLGEVDKLGLAGWEELHTRTLDLAPVFAPYVGYVIWGDSYQRGEFMAEMKGAQDKAGIDRYGELPDHLDPIARYLAAVDEPSTWLVELFPKAIGEMKKTLNAAEKDNPYRYVLQAMEEAAGNLAAPVGGAG